MNRKDYYNILKINKDASTKEIKKSYRKLAMEFHPDLYKGKDAGNKFKEINEAYAVLSDSEKRQIYDSTGNLYFNSSLNRHADFGETLHRPFCSRRGRGMGRGCGGMGRFSGQHFGALKNAKNVEYNDLTFNLSLSYNEAKYGTEKYVIFNSGPYIKQYRIMISPGVKNGDLIKINHENCYLRIKIIEKGNHQTKTHKEK